MPQPEPTVRLPLSVAKKARNATESAAHREFSHGYDTFADSWLEATEAIDAAIRKAEDERGGG